jgi:hypothetical protein
MLIIFFSHINAQDIFVEEDVSRLVIPEAGVSYMVPIGDFAEKLESKGIGLEAGVHFQLDPDHPFTIGLLGSYHYIDRVSINFTEEIDGIPTDLNESITTQVLNFTGVLRYYLPINFGETKFYTDLIIGPKIFFATYKLIDDDGGEFVNEFEVEQSDVSLSYGLSGGIQAPIWKYIHLNAKATYLPGISVSFYNEIDPPIASPVFAIDAFELNNSATQSLYFSLGLSFFL